MRAIATLYINPESSVSLGGLEMSVYDRLGYGPTPDRSVSPWKSVDYSGEGYFVKGSNNLPVCLGWRPKKSVALTKLMAHTNNSPRTTTTKTKLKLKSLKPRGTPLVTHLRVHHLT